MLTALEYLQYKSIATKTCTIGCSNCMFSDDYNPGMDAHCGQFETKYPALAIQKIEQWVKEHPIKTRMTLFLEQYPNAAICAMDELPDISPCDMGWTINGGSDCKNQDCAQCRIKYWCMPIWE